MLSVQYHLRRCMLDKEVILHSHFHNDLEILMPLSNGGHLSIANKIYPLKRGTLFIMNQYTLHNQVTPSSAYERYILHIDPQVLASISTAQTDFAKRINSANHAIDISNNIDYFIDLFSRLETSFCNSFGGDILQIKHFLELILEVCNLIKPDQQEPRLSTNPEIMRIMLIQSYIHEHLAEPLTLDSIADQFFISKYYLCRLFKSTTNYGIIEYVNYSRISKACQLMREGVRSKVAGESVGFQSNEHFIRTFKKLVGSTPKQYSQKYASAVQYGNKSLSETSPSVPCL